MWPLHASETIYWVFSPFAEKFVIILFYVIIEYTLGCIGTF